MSITKMKTSEKGVDFIKRQEGCELVKYQDEAGYWTIGVGHLIKTTENFDKGLTEKEAIELLMTDLVEFEDAVNKVKTKQPLLQHQFDSLVSFSFNIGVGNFNNSTLRRELVNGNLDKAALQFIEWRKITIKGEKVESPGLLDRRLREKYLFDKGIYNGQKQYWLGSRVR